jgi:hypothetical protein
MGRDDRRRQLVEVLAEGQMELLEEGQTYTGNRRDVKGYHQVAGYAMSDKAGRVILNWGPVGGAAVVTEAYPLAADPILPGVLSVVLPDTAIVRGPGLRVDFENQGGNQTAFDLYVEVRQRA